MYKVGVKQLKNELSRHVKAAAAGETVLVTDRVVAELGPPRSEPEPWADHPLADLIRQGIVRPATDRSGLPPRPFSTMTFEEVMADLDESRADRDLPG